MPYEPDPYRGRSATLERPRAEDVYAARAAVSNAHTPYGAPRKRRPADRWSDFAARYGWRAYALPLLAVITVAALVTSGSGSSGSKNPPRDVAQQGPATAGKATTSAPQMAPSSMDLKNDAPGANSDNALVAAAALPSGAPYTMRGKGTFRTLPGTTKKVGSGPLFRYTIDVENGVTGVDLAQFQQLVDSTLDDPRSWSGHGVALQRVDSGYANFHVTLTSALTVRKFCGYDIPVETSCYAQASATGDVNRVVLNIARWQRGAQAYIGDLGAYRIYMINHEDGHALGHNHAHQCLPGGLAPVMMQQTFGLKSAATGQLCGANPWPYPPGVKGAPGAEQLDTASNNEYGR